MTQIINKIINNIIGKHIKCDNSKNYQVTGPGSMVRPLVPLPNKLSKSPTKIVGIKNIPGNPSAIAAKKAGLKYETITNNDGSQSGVVTLKGGQKVDSWIWFNNKDNYNKITGSIQKMFNKQ